MLQTRSYEMCRSSGNLIQWGGGGLFYSILVYNGENKPMLCYKFGSVYIFFMTILGLVMSGKSLASDIQTNNP